MKRTPTPKQLAYWQHMSETDGWRKIGKKGGDIKTAKYGSAHAHKIGKKGGRANVDKHGPEHMAEIGHRGGLKLIDNLGGREAAKEYFSKIAKIKTKKETTHD